MRGEGGTDVSRSRKARGRRAPSGRSEERPAEVKPLDARCVVCDSPWRAAVDEFMVMGDTDTQLAAFYGLHEEVFRQHRLQHFDYAKAAQDRAALLEAERQGTEMRRRAYRESARRREGERTGIPFCEEPGCPERAQFAHIYAFGEGRKLCPFHWLTDKHSGIVMNLGPEADARLRGERH